MGPVFLWLDFDVRGRKLSPFPPLDPALTDEREIVARILKGDEEAFEQLYRALSILRGEPYHRP